MQVIVEQMNAVKTVIGDGLTILDDVIFSTVDSFLCKATSDRAVQLYRTGWAIAVRPAKVAWWIVGLMMAAAFFSGVLARRIWDDLGSYVAQCEAVKVEPVEVMPEAIAEDEVEVAVALPVAEEVAPKPVKRKTGAKRVKKASQAA